MDNIKQRLDRQIALLPRDVVFCRKCVVSNQRPRITLDEAGVCSACRYAEEKKSRIDWAKRREELERLCDKHRRNDGAYDVVVPCSGGKDSAAVAYKLKAHFGMHPLTVTWAPFSYTDIGWRNYQAFIASGFANVMMHPNGALHRKLARIGFEAVGDIFLPFIYGQMAFAFHVAVQNGISLIFFGENGEAEYGGSTADNDRPYRPVEDWADVYFKGVTVDDAIAWGEAHGVLKPREFDAADLTFYRPPPVDTLKASSVQMHWFSYYQRWVPQENFYCAAEHTGFQPNPAGRSQGTYSKYASLDDKLDGLHYYLAYIKFGLGRCTSDAAHEIRDDHLTREEGVALVRQYDGEFPAAHMKETLAYIDMSEDEMWRVIDSFRTPHLWDRVGDTWKLKRQVS